MGTVTTSLTAAQGRMLNTIQQHHRKFGYTPSIRNLCQLLSLRSTSTVHQHVKALARKGYVRIAGRRGIVLLSMDPSPTLEAAVERVLGNARRIDAGSKVEAFFYGDCYMVSADAIDALRRAHG